VPAGPLIQQRVVRMLMFHGCAPTLIDAIRERLLLAMGSETLVGDARMTAAGACTTCGTELGPPEVLHESGTVGASGSWRSTSR